MALNYYSSFGYYTNTETDIDGVTHQYREDIHNANCMCCGLYHFTHDGKDYARPMWYFDNVRDMKRQIKSGRFDSCNDFVFMKDKMNKDDWKLVSELEKLGKSITIV